MEMQNLEKAMSDFISCLSRIGLQQYTDLLLLLGHILDLISCSGVTPLNSMASDLSKSKSFNDNLTLSKSHLARSTSFRTIKKIDVSAFSNGLDNLPNRDNISTPDELASHYKDGLHSLLDSFAPLKTTEMDSF